MNESLNREEITSNAAESPSGAQFTFVRLLVVILEIALVAALCVVWFTFESIRTSHNLWVLFLYSFPSQFLIAIAPHEPVFFYFSKLYAPWIVTLVAVTGTLLTELVNYTVIGFFAELRPSKKVLDRRIVRKLTELFRRAPSLTLLVAGFTPVPFYPFRFLVILAKYPLWKYLIAVFVARSARFYVFALIGHALRIPDHLLLLFFVGISILILTPVIREFFVTPKQESTAIPASDGASGTRSPHGGDGESGREFGGS